MALFKIEKGLSEKLTINRPEAHEGWCYFTTDTGKMYIDIDDGNIETNPELRVCLNASHADSATTATKWETSRNINGMTVNGSANRVNYGTCGTAAATVAKTVSCTGFALITGSEITVKFTVTNTATNPTLNVNSTGAKPIYYRGSNIDKSYLQKDRTYTFRYNGTQYDLVGDINTNTTYNAAGESLGLVKSGGDITIAEGVITVNDDSHSHVISNIDNLTDTLDNINEKLSQKLDLTNKGEIIPEGADLDTYIAHGQFNSPNTERSNTLSHCPINDSGFRLIVFQGYSGYPSSQVILGYGNSFWYRSYRSSQKVWTDWAHISKQWKLSDFGITATAQELNYTDGVTSNIQTQLDNKASLKLYNDYYELASDAEIDAMLMTYINDANFTRGARHLTLYPTASGTSLPYGTIYFIDICKSSANYGTILVRGYGSAAPDKVKLYMRAWIENTLQEWVDLRRKVVGATVSEDGKIGLVPKPVKGDQLNYLCGDGTWKPVTTLQIGTLGDSKTPVYFKNGAPTICDYNFSQYLPLIGGDMTGNILINATGARYQITNGEKNLWFGINVNGTSWGIYDVNTEKYIIHCTDNKTTFSGNANTATQLNTPRAFTIGATAKDFDGSAAVSWTHAEIGATVSNTITNGTTAGPTLKTTVNGVTGTAVTIPAATASISGIVTTGSQHFAGQKFFDAAPVMYNHNTSPSLYFYPKQAKRTQGSLQCAYTHTDGIGTGNRMQIVEWSYNSTTAAANSHYEIYNFPKVTADRTSNASYEIFTSKSYSTLDGRYVNASGDTMTGILTFKNTTASPAVGTQMPIMRMTYQNGEGTYYGNINIIAMLGTGETGGTTNTSVRFGSTSGSTFITSGESGSYMPAKLGTNNEHLWLTSDSGTYFYNGCANDGSSYTKTLSITSSKITAHVKLYGAVWNDYAEYRNQEEEIEPGYCVASFNNGQVYKTTEKLQACDGIVSDTFGFAIGETEECKTPLAVAGRVLAYCNGNRYDYHAGDTVCAGPGGLVYKMTREEIKEYPDRIIGIVSEIPEYENWGNKAIKVNNRIWIKVK